METVSFSKRCRGRVNEKFSELRKILEIIFPNCQNWNRFHIIDLALIAISGKPAETGSDPLEPALNRSNKEACAFYRAKMNAAFENLKNEIEKSAKVNSNNYRLFTRAGILQAAIDLIRQTRFLPVPIFPPTPTRGLKRKMEENSDDERFFKMRKTPESTESISPKSEIGFSPPETTERFNRLVQTQALFRFYAAIAQFQIHQPVVNTTTWRAWL